MIVLRVVIFLIGAALTVGTLFSAVQTVVVPRAAVTFITRSVFVVLRALFNQLARPTRPYAVRDRIMAVYGPLALLCLPAIWLTLIVVSYMAMFWAIEDVPLRAALDTSGSSLFTLGFIHPDTLAALLLTFAEAAIGLALLALLISYLPTIYAAFARRETAVTLLEGLAGTPPSPVTMLTRQQRIGGLATLSETWRSWQVWFAEVEESHLSQPALCFFRSPQPDRSWITAAGCILDAAALTLACLDFERDAHAQLCLRMGFISLRHIAGFYGIPFNPEPTPDDPIAIQREEFDEVWETLQVAKLPLRPDREQAWRDFAGWRVNYDGVLIGLASLIMAPIAPWSSDRSLPYRRPPLLPRLRLPARTE